MHIRPSAAAKRDEFAKPSGASLLPPVGTLALCLLTFGVSMAQGLFDRGRWGEAVGVVPASVWHFSSLTRVGEGQVLPGWLTLFSYMFLHGGWWHVVPNMAGLWVFGALAEPVMGRRRFVLSYLASGVVGAFGLGLVLPHSLKPVTGASLAISGILGAYSALRLSARTRTRGPSVLIGVLEVAAVLGVGAWLMLRTDPREVDLACSVLYHLLPFIVAWMSVRMSNGLRRLAQRAWRS